MMTWDTCVLKFSVGWRRTLRPNAPPDRVHLVWNTRRFGKSIVTFGLRIHRSKPSCRNSPGVANVATDPEYGNHKLKAEERELEEAVERARGRREHWLRSGEWPMGRALAMMGRFGWTIVAPILLGAFVGRWLDRTFHSGVFWSAALVFLGAALGFWAVWQRMNSE